jgi:hypothetical protein
VIFAATAFSIDYVESINADTSSDLRAINLVHFADRSASSRIRVIGSFRRASCAKACDQVITVSAYTFFLIGTEN